MSSVASHHVFLQFDPKTKQPEPISRTECCAECLVHSWNSGKGYFCCILICLLIGGAILASYTLYDFVHGDDDMSWNLEIEETITDNSLLYNAIDSWPICEEKWNGNLSSFDLTVMAEMVYALGQDDLTMLSHQEMMCLYFDTMDIAELRNESSNLTESDCAWQVVYNATHFPYFMHLRNDNYSTDLIAIRGTYSMEEAMQDFVLYNQVVACRFEVP